LIAFSKITVDKVARIIISKIIDLWAEGVDRGVYGGRQNTGRDKGYQ